MFSSQQWSVHWQHDTTRSSNAPPQVALRRTVVPRSYAEDGTELMDVYEFPNPKFIEDCKNEFPEKMIASAEEARVSSDQRAA